MNHMISSMGLHYDSTHHEDDLGQYPEHYRSPRDLDLIRGSPYRSKAAEFRFQKPYRRAHSITNPHGRKPLASRAATREALS